MSKFTLIDSGKVADIKGECIIYEHVKTKALVVFMKNDDTHRSMNIVFRTPPKDNRGIPHIIEHSVFCGSDKYPIEDPFVELMKGTMYTFLNALTYSDITSFPVASTNEKDFDKLVDVYLDAVFNPRLTKDPSVFNQEGWQYERVGEEITANGVVLNEMKGAFTSAEAVIERGIKEALFADTSYRYVSGGVPSEIIKLTYKEFLEYYVQYYHPSNCIVIFYGDIDIEKKLDYLDVEYFAKYSYRSKDAVVAKQRPFDSTKIYDCSYPVSDEKGSANDYIAYAMTIDSEHSAEFAIVIQMIDYVLSAASGSLVREAVMKSGISEDFETYLDDGLRQPYYVFQASYCSTKDYKKFTKIIDNELRKLCEHGIDKDMLRAALKTIDFTHREADFTGSPKGLVYSDYILERLIYHEDNPIDRIRISEAIETVKSYIDTDYFEKFVRHNFIENNHKAVVLVHGDEQLLQKTNDEFNEILRSNYDESAIPIAADKTLAAADNYIAVLAKEDLNVERKYVPTITKEICGIPAYFQERETNGIGYVNLAMDIRALPKRLHNYVRVLVELLAELDTKKHSYKELTNLIDSETGGIYNYIEIADRTVVDGDVIPQLIQHSSFFYEEMDENFALNIEILLETMFEDTEYIYELLMQLKSVYVSQYAEGNTSVARNICLEGFSQAAVWHSELQGYDFYLFLENITRAFKTNFAEHRKCLYEALDILLHQGNLAIYYIGERCSFDSVEKCISKYFSNHRIAYAKLEASDVCLKGGNRAYIIPSQVQYIAMCSRITGELRNRRGHLLVLEHIINCDYLWNNVRVKGGAYGSSIQIGYNQTLALTSYRDPRTEETLEVFKNLADYVRTLELSERELMQYIVGTMNKLEAPLSAEAEGMVQFRQDIAGITNEEILAVRQQVVNTRLEDIRELWTYIDEALKNADVVLLGNEKEAYERLGIFEQIQNIIA